ncbi:MAG: hypothetical protein JSU72_09330 [Deltaproteobacteria bacterium]|nr:MAG: hypothetical protein JSU72_09330 [Deltaproteobacteria bacterium]
MDADGIKDNAGNFRYSKNYLNWLFFAEDAGGSPLYAGFGTDLPDKSRFYFAKKAILNVAKLTSNKGKFGLYSFTSSSEGASNVQPLQMVVDTVAADPSSNILDSSFVNNVNNMGTVTYSPLAEGLATIAGYFNSPSSSLPAGMAEAVDEYCQKLFAVVVSPGLSSKDLHGYSTSYLPQKRNFLDDDGDNDAGGIGEGNIKEDKTTDGVDNDGDSNVDEADEAVIMAIPTGPNGSTYLDDIAYYLRNHDCTSYRDGVQTTVTYTVGFMGDRETNLFLINTSNNGNDNVNLYDTSHPEYGKYHFTAESPDVLADELLAAVNDILSRTSSFTAPVVPVTRTFSGNRIYMAFFKPSEGNFWEGNVTKFGLSEDGLILDINGNVATYANGSLIEDAEPYWQTKDWADSTTSRNIYTYMGSSDYLTDSTNAFSTSNASLTPAVLGNPTHSVAEIINYVRGADVFDGDGDGDTTENRAVITGDILHSEPLVVQYNSSTAMVYFGANDGMLHAVQDSDGSEAWAFIPSDQLPRLKDIVEGTDHQYFVDSSPKAYINDVNGDGVIDSSGGDQVILVCGQRKGSTSYFALDVSDPSQPKFLGMLDQSSNPVLGESWSEPQFGRVKTSDADTTGTPALFIGAGYSATNTVGNAVLVINLNDGSLLKEFSGIAGMDYSFASSVTIVDADDDGFVDKMYIGDLGGQLWRFGKFTDPGGDPLIFPDTDENINNWTGQILFSGVGKFFYPPAVTLEKGYDMVFLGTGDREDACNGTTSDTIYAVKDTHAATSLTEADLVNVTDPSATPPDLHDPTGDVDSNGQADQGWYIRLATGEKVLAEGTVFYKVFYLTTFTPNNDPCVPGGYAKVYALSHLTGAPTLAFESDTPIRSAEIGGGIPSKPVTVITPAGAELLISVGSTSPDDVSLSVEAGIVTKKPVEPPRNFFYLWWKELFG